MFDAGVMSGESEGSAVFQSSLSAAAASRLCGFIAAGMVEQVGNMHSTSPGTTRGLVESTFCCVCMLDVEAYPWPPAGRQANVQETMPPECRCSVTQRDTCSRLPGAEIPWKDVASSNVVRQGSL